MWALGWVVLVYIFKKQSCYSLHKSYILSISEIIFKAK